MSPTKSLTAFCLILISIHAKGDLIVTESLSSNGEPHNQTLKIKGDLIRADSGDHSTIINTASGDFTVINNAQKSYFKMSGDQMKAATEKMHAMFPSAGAAARPVPVDSGTSEKVGTYEAEIYTAQSPMGQFTYWVAKDYPNAAALKDQLSQLQNNMGNKLGSNFTPDTSKLPGVNVKTETTMMGRTTTTTLISIQDTSIDDSAFQIPPDFTAQSIPGFGGGQGSAAKPAQ